VTFATFGCGAHVAYFKMRTSRVNCDWIIDQDDLLTKTAIGCLASCEH